MLHNICCRYINVDADVMLLSAVVIML